MTPSQKRDGSIDLLRCIALIGIVLAHVSPHPAILQLRGFDVPMMVFLSGAVFFRGEESPLDIGYLAGYWARRIKRIVFPVWLFLCFYIPVIYALSGHLPLMSHSGILEVFTLQTSWFVWIFRVFLIVALAAPFLAVPARRAPVGILYLSGVVVLLLLGFVPLSRKAGFLYYAVEAIPYIVVFLFGMLANRTDRKWMLLITLAWLVVYALLAVWKFSATGHYVDTGSCKYPPRMYYLAYGMGCIGILWLIKDGLMKCLKRVPFLEKLLVFMGSHTMWIYLWHILFLEFVGFFCRHAAGVVRFTHLPFWFARFAFVLVLSCLLTYLQSLIVTRWRSSHPDNPVLKCFYPVLVG